MQSAQDWAWSSARWWKLAEGRPSYLAEGPVPRPKNWLTWVNKPNTLAELAAIRRSVERGTPYGNPAWITAAAQRLGLESTTRPRGRPRKENADQY